MPGVKKVVQVGDSAVAVVADTWWRAKTALDALPIVWDEGPNAKLSSDGIAAVAEGRARRHGGVFVGNKAGDDVKAALASAAKKVEAVYSYPFQNHATMEPMNATALWTPDKCEVWTPTQNGEAALAAAAEASGLPIAKVRRLQAAPRRRLRPPRRRPRLRPPGGRDRQADAGHADQADLDPRGGHDARRATTR